MVDGSSTDEFWCPLGDASAAGNPTTDMTPADWAALSRLGIGEWISDVQIERLESLGLIERVFGQAVLTRLGRVRLGMSA